MPSWGDRMREDWTLAELVDFFDNEPFDFEPGAKWHYDNSGYVLLGMILEKVTGKKYADVVADMIFRPLGMKETRYGDDAPIVPGRVAGYVKTPAGIVNAPFLSMTQPFSAGAIVSTADDLARWQAALDAGTILTPESRRKMWTPVDAARRNAHALRLRLGHVELRGAPPSSSTAAASTGSRPPTCGWPDDRLYVAVLSNCGGCADPRALALGAASILDRQALDGPSGRRDRAGAARPLRRHVHGQRRRRLGRPPQGRPPRPRGRPPQLGRLARLGRPSSSSATPCAPCGS